MGRQGTRRGRHPAGLRTLVGRWTGSGVRDIADPLETAPVRPSEVAQGGFVTLRVVDKVWVGLRVGAIVDRRSVQAWSHPVGLDGSTRRTIQKASARHGEHWRKTHDARIVDMVTYRI